MIKRSTIAYRLPLAVLLALATGGAAAATPEGRLVAITELAVENRAVFEGSDAISVKFTLHNDTLETARVLVWQTPLAGFTNDLFYVERDGEPVPYTGRLMKWGTPTAEDYVAIEPGSFVSTTFDPSEVYDMSAPGQYTISYRTELLDFVSSDRLHERPGKVAPGVRLESVQVDASDLVFRVGGVQKGTKGGIGGGGGEARPPTFVGCTNERQAALLEALATAGRMAAESRGYLQSLPESQRPSNARYGEWFGTYGSANYSTVTTNFVALTSAFSTQTVEFFCDCESSSFAYVYPTKPYEIHLCKAFWNAAMTGTDSKGGTLIHEMSHFDVVANTDDIRYGQLACRNLAITAPQDAIRNADSHEYFAEAGTP